MDNNLRKEYSKIILFIQQKRVSNKKDIAKYTGDKWHNGGFKAKLNYLIKDGYLQNTHSDVYEITPKGDGFKSYEEKEMQNSNKSFLENRIRELTIENLQLQNKNIKRQVLFLVASFVIGAITTNLKDILFLLKITPQ